MARRAEVLARLPVVLGYSREEAAASIGISAGTFDTMVTEGEMPRPRKVRGRLVWDLDDLRNAFKTLPREGEERANSWADFR